MKSLICTYCGEVTTDKENLEHVVSESLGGNDTLYRGAVCNRCNHRLGIKIESKVFHDGFLAAAVVAAGIKGKNGIKSKLRCSNGVGFVAKTKNRVSLNETTVGGDNFYEISRLFLKFAVNILVNKYDSKHVRLKHMDLINYVKTGVVSKTNYAEPHFVIIRCCAGFFGVPIKKTVENYIDTRNEINKIVSPFKNKDISIQLSFDVADDIFKAKIK